MAVILLVLVPALAHAQAPANDSCVNATNLTLVNNVQNCQSGTTVNATPQLPYPRQLACQPSGTTNMPNTARDVWYKFTAPAGATKLKVELSGAMATLDLGLYTGSCGSLTGVGCGAIPSASGPLTATFSPIVPGTTYFIQVSGGSVADVGTFNLCLTLLAPPDNDSCSHATGLGTLTLNTQSCTAGNNDEANAEQPYPYGTACQPTGSTNMANQARDVWYTFQMPPTGNRLQVDVTSNLDTVNIGIYQGTCTSRTYVGCAAVAGGNLSTFFNTLTPGITYYLQFSGGGITDTGTFNLCLTALLAPPPPNDTCFNATNLGTLPNGSQSCQSGTTVNANPEFPYPYQVGCNPSGNSAIVANDVWYRFTTAANSNSLIVNLTGTIPNANISLYRGTSCGSLLALGCAVGTTSVIDTFTGLQANTTYYIQVNGSSTSSSQTGTFNLCLTSYNNANICTSNGYLSVSPIPPGGVFTPGTVVQFCYTMAAYNQNGANWFHGVSVSPGPGWDPSSLVVISIPTSCDGQGNWGYYNSCTGTSAASGGVSYGPGFYYDSGSGGPLDGNPGNNFGDNCTNHTWVFCWSYTVSNSGTSNNLSMCVQITGDGASGSWNNPACPPEPPTCLHLIATNCPAPTVHINNPTCPGVNNGSARAIPDPSNTNTPFTYSWSGPNGFAANTDSISGLAPGFYTLTLTDITNCQVITAVSIQNPSAISLNVDSFDIKCNGATTGKAWATINGSSGPFTYTWNTTPPRNTDTITGLTAGVYTVTVGLPGGCSITDSTVVHQTDSFTVTKFPHNVTCNGANNGSVQIYVTGATLPYQYVWNTVPQTLNTDTLSNLAPRVYTVTITDANGCTKIDSVNITQPAAVTVTVVGDSVKCNGTTTGRAWATPNGGTAPFSYAWNTTPVQTTDTAINLSATNYTVTVTDSNGCRFTGNVSIRQPAAITANTFTQAATCQSGGTAIAIAAGGAGGFTYAWNTSPPQNTSTATNLPGGTYTVTITDARNCSITKTVTITAPSNFTVTQGSDSTTCSGGSNGRAWINVTGSTGPYSINWGTTPAQTTDTISNLTAGNYYVTVTDNSNCHSSYQVAVGEPEAITFLFGADSVNCTSPNSGKAWAQVTGGIPPYVLHWSNNASTDTIYNLTAGTYNLTVTDAHNCTNSGTVTVAQPNNLNAVATIYDLKCNGDSSGRVLLNVTGGIRPYHYLWSTGDTIYGISHLAPGTYDVTITDNSGCQFTLTNNVTEPGPIVLTPHADTVRCGGTNTGLASVVATGGTLPYVYQWAPGTTINNDTFPNLAAGTYYMTVTDSNFCQVHDSVVVEPRIAMSDTIFNDTLSCYGGNNGALTALTADGTPPYTYMWSTTTAQTTATATNLIAGLYKVTVTDANGCIKKDSAIVAEPPALIAAVQTDSANCFNGSDGKAWANVSGGTAPYQYQWSAGTPSNLDTVSNLTAGGYSVIINDANGCTLATNGIVYQPAGMTVTPTINNVKCNGGATGVILLSVTGGVTPYSFLWSNTSTQQNASGLVAGSYDVTVTDANGCTMALTGLVVGEPAPLALTATPDSAKCFGSHDGAIALTVTGGNTPYTTFNWSNYAPAVQNPTGLVAGTYKVTVTDSKGCKDSTTAIIEQPTALVVDSIIDTVKCFGTNTGSIEVTVTGGSAPYTYAWDNGPTAALNSQLAAGTYAVTVTDYKQCQKVKHYILTQPDTLVIDSLVIMAPTSCPTTLLSLPLNQYVQGGVPPYSFVWSDGSYTQDITINAFGTYTVTTTDTKGCTVTASIDVPQPDPLVVTVVTDTAKCYGANSGHAQADATGGYGGYQYVWNNTDTTGPIKDSLDAGNYTIEVIDRLGCTATNTFTVYQHPAVTVNAGEDITLEIGTDTTLSPQITGLLTNDNVVYTWTPSTALSCVDCPNPVANPIDTTLYTLSIDVNGCLYADSLYLFVRQDHIFYAPNAFTPNGDGLNDTYFIQAKGVRKFELKIFNRWGDIVYISHDVNDAWDGNFLGKPADQAVYVYDLYIEYLDRYNFRKHGSLTLLR